MRRSLVAALLITSVGACAPEGDRADAPDGAVGSERESEAGPARTAADEPATLSPMEVTGTATDTIELRSEGPTLQFLPDRISASSGERVLLRYENGGDLPHNFALFRREESIDRMASAAYDAESTGFIPVAAADELIAYTLLVSPGQTAEAEFIVPPPGRYTFICLFPGHAQMMLGVLTAR